MKKCFDKKLIIEDGTEYNGFSFGYNADCVTELVFNTSVAGYQEILSDPSYTYQTVVMSYPLIGNYGINDGDFEAEVPTIGGLIVKEYNDEPSNWRSEYTLSEVMQAYKIPGLCGVDTRKLVRSIRDCGSLRAYITSPETKTADGIETIRRTLVPHDAVKKVSRKQAVRYSAQGNRIHVVAIDCGIKQNIINSLLLRGANVTVVPYDTSAQTIEALKPDGIFISNGPGDPVDVPKTIATVKRLLGTYPMFGICLGHQIIALAYGAKTYKLKFGHRGGNHPVKNIFTHKIAITAQNHSYAVDEKSLSATPLTATHINLLDKTVEGLACKADKVFSVQYHPEGAPGPQENAHLFDEFIGLIKENQHA